MQTDNHVVQKFDTRKIYQLSNEVIFFAPYFVCFSLFAFNLARRQSYAYAIGLYTRPEIKSSCTVRFATELQLAHVFALTCMYNMLSIQSGPTCNLSQWITTQQGRKGEKV